MSDKPSNRNPITEFEDTTDPFVPVTPNFIQENKSLIETAKKVCDEFGTMTGEEEITPKKKTSKKGYDPMSVECGECKLSLLCSSVARVFDIPNKAVLVKEGFAHPWFYDESRVKELSNAYIKKIKELIGSYHAQGKYPKADKVLKLIDNYCTSPEGLRSADPEMPSLIYQRIMNDLKDSVCEKEIDGEIKIVPIP